MAVSQLDDTRVKTEPASSLVGNVVAPGDEILDLTTAERVVRLGGGLRQEGDSVVVVRAGRLRSAKNNKLWVEGSQKRYLPSVGDAVLGVVTDRHSENFDIDIGGPSLALLPVLAFEGASRRNRPNLQVGTAVYARVAVHHPDRVPELVCTDVSGKAAGFGPLTGGYIFSCSTGLARALLGTPTCPVLEALGGSLSFEIAVGMNGRVWVNSSKYETTVLISNAITNAAYLPPSLQRSMVKQLLTKVS